MSQAFAHAPPELAPIPGRAVFLLAAAAFASGATARICDPLLPQLAAQFSVTTGAASAVITAFVLTYGVLQALFGPAGDRFGKYRVMAAATLVSAATTGACALAGSLQALTLLRLLSGASAAAIIPLAMAWIGDSVPYSRRQPVLARFLTGQLTGLILGQAGGGALGEHFGWRSAFLLLGLVYLAAAAGLFWELRRNPLTRPPRPAIVVPVLKAWRDMALLTRDPWVRVLLASVFIEGMATFGAFAFAGASLHERFGIGLDHVGLIIAVYGLGGLLYTFIVGRLIARVGERGVAQLGAGVLALGFAMLAITPNLWGAGLATGCVGFGFYALYATLQTNATQMAPAARGSAVALFASFFFLGQSVGVWGGGALVDAFGTIPPFLMAMLILPALGFWFGARLSAHTGAA